MKQETTKDGRRRAPVNFHSIAALVGSDTPSQQYTQHTAANVEICMTWKVSAPGHEQRMSPLTIITPSRDMPLLTSTPIRSQQSHAPDSRLLACTTPEEAAARPAKRPGSTGTCSSANTSSSSECSAAMPGEESDNSVCVGPGAHRVLPSMKKARTIYKAQQVCMLEQVFAATHYPDADYVERLAAELDISEGKIKVWFQNKRARWRRRQSRSTEDAVHGSPDGGDLAKCVAPYGTQLPRLDAERSPISVGMGLAAAFHPAAAVRAPSTGGPVYPQYPLPDMSACGLPQQQYPLMQQYPGVGAFLPALHPARGMQVADSAHRYASPARTNAMIAMPFSQHPMSLQFGVHSSGHAQFPLLA